MLLDEKTGAKYRWGEEVTPHPHKTQRKEKKMRTVKARTAFEIRPTSKVFAMDYSRCVTKIWKSHATRSYKNYLKLYTVKYLVIVNQPSQHHNHRATVLDYHLPEVLIGVR